MKKAFAIFLILAGSVAIVRSADISIMVGSDTDELVFTPQTVNAIVGDNLVFTWAGKIPHIIVQTDTAKSCVKSATLNNITSDGPFTAPKMVTIQAKAAGKMWYMCAVADHCAKGMYGIIFVEDGAAGGAPTAGAPGAAGASAAPSGAPASPVGGTPTEAGGTPTGGTAPSGETKGAIPSSVTSAPAGNGTSNNTSNMVGPVIGALVGGIVLTIGIFFLYKWFRNKNVILVSGENRNDNYNPRYNHNPRNDNYNSEYNYNHENRQIPESENQVHNNRSISPAPMSNVVHNHGQEAAPISEDNNNNVLHNYIVEIVKQELQNQ